MKTDSEASRCRNMIFFPRKNTDISIYDDLDTSVVAFEHCLLLYWKARQKIRAVRYQKYCYDDNKCKISKEAKVVIVIATMAFTTCLPHVSSTELREKSLNEKFERYLFT